MHLPITIYVGIYLLQFVYVFFQTDVDFNRPCYEIQF